MPVRFIVVLLFVRLRLLVVAVLLRVLLVVLVVLVVVRFLFVLVREVEEARDEVLEELLDGLLDVVVLKKASSEALKVSTVLWRTIFPCFRKITSSRMFSTSEIRCVEMRIDAFSS